MGRFRRFLHTLPARRAAAIALAVVLLLVTLSGAVWAVSGSSKSKALDTAASYTITLTPTKGAGEVKETVSWKIGQAYVTSSCWAVYDETLNPDKISVFWDGVVKNTGSDPMGVVNASGESIRLGPGSSVSDMGPLATGQIIDHLNYPGPSAELGMIAFLTEGGSSASGTWAGLARVEPSTGTATCVFTLQMRG